MSFINLHMSSVIHLVGLRNSSGPLSNQGIDLAQVCMSSNLRNHLIMTDSGRILPEMKYVCMIHYVGADITEKLVRHIP